MKEISLRASNSRIGVVIAQRGELLVRRRQRVEQFVRSLTMWNCNRSPAIAATALSAGTSGGQSSDRLSPPKNSVSRFWIGIVANLFQRRLTPFGNTSTSGFCGATPRPAARWWVWTQRTARKFWMSGPLQHRNIVGMVVEARTPPRSRPRSACAPVAGRRRRPAAAGAARRSAACCLIVHADWLQFVDDLRHHRGIGGDRLHRLDHPHMANPAHRGEHGGHDVDRLDRTGAGPPQVVDRRGAALVAWPVDAERRQRRFDGADEVIGLGRRNNEGRDIDGTQPRREQRPAGSSRT